MLIDRQGRCLRANAFGLSLIGLPSEKLLGRPFRDLWPDEVKPQVDDAVSSVLSGKEASFDACQFAPSGKRWMAVVLAPLHGDSGAVEKIISIATDISDRKKAEEERTASYEYRLAVERMHNLEKERLMMDLHDGIGGIATNIRIVAEVGQRAADGDSMKMALGSIAQLSQEGIAEIRSFMHSIDMTGLSWGSLGAELKYQGSGMLDPHGISFQFTSSVQDDIQRPGSLLWINLFKIYKEAITNIVKHSRATRVEVGLTVKHEGLELSIRDNGIGWVDRQTTTGRGISNMHKRALEMRGKVTIENNNGLLIELTIPLPFAVA